MFRQFFSRSSKKARALPPAPAARWRGVVLGAAVLLAALGYVALINAVATKGYKIKKLEQQFNELKEVNKKLEITSASLQSLAVIEAGLDKNVFVAVEKLEYLAAIPPEAGVAIK